MRTEGPPVQRGFTLIELMIVVALVAILLSVALPAFQSQMRRTNRAAAQAVMLDIANRQEQYFLANRSYADRTALEASGFRLDSDVEGKYSYDIETNPGPPPTYTITFTAQGHQASDGDLTLDSVGVAKPADKWQR